MTSDQPLRYQNLKDYRYTLARERSLFYIQLYRLVFCLLIKPSPKFMHGWRRVIYRIFGAKIGKGVKISPSARFLYPWNIAIGNYCWIGDHVDLYSVDKITVGDHVAFAHNVFVFTAAHDIHRVSFDTIPRPVTIENEVWVASNVVINMGVTLSRGVVVGSGSVVTKDLPEGYVCFGNPARPIKKRIAS
ncbi:MAG: colanic acid biosynthesis acetyltransferase WcaF [Gammaproteobacteria bacterium]